MNSNSIDTTAQSDPARVAIFPSPAAWPHWIHANQGQKQDNRHKDSQ